MGFGRKCPQRLNTGPKAGVPRIALVGTTTTRGDRSEWRIYRAVACAVAGRCARALSRSVTNCAVCANGKSRVGCRRRRGRFKDDYFMVVVVQARWYRDARV
jgi:hypothetical protein